MLNFLLASFRKPSTRGYVLPRFPPFCISLINPWEDTGKLELISCDSMHDHKTKERERERERVGGRERERERVGGRERERERESKFREREAVVQVEETFPARPDDITSRFWGFLNLRSASFETSQPPFLLKTITVRKCFQVLRLILRLRFAFRLFNYWFSTNKMTRRSRNSYTNSFG